MVRIALPLVGLALATGCEGRLNQAYCAQAENRDDPDCLEAGYVRFDAPPPECSSDPDCAGKPGGSVCDVSQQRCVTCIKGLNEAACTSMMQVCGPDEKCHGCIVDTDCTSRVCLASQSCATATNVLYAAPAGSGTTCTTSALCTFSEAARQLTPERHIIKLTTLNGTDYTDAPITINATYGVQIIGTATRFTPTGSGPAITASGANLEILGLTIDSAGGDGVRCTGGVLTLQDATISNSTAWGVAATTCDLRLLRSRLSSNRSGAVSAIGGTHLIRNNVMDRNGNNNLENGNVHIETGRGRFVFNTLVNSISRNGGSRTGGIGCSEAASGAFIVAQNIVAAWGDAGNAIQGCTLRDNVVTRSIGNLNFADNQFHLSADSPPAVLDVQSVVVDADCKDAGASIDDIDGQSRPFNTYCDRGADEYRP